MDRIYHLAQRHEWQLAAERGDSYRRSTLDKSLEEEGFIHCSFGGQVQGVADRFYRGQRDVVLLEIDPLRLDADLRVENLQGGDERFPHIYGPLPIAAVVAVEPVDLRADGTLNVDALGRPFGTGGIVCQSSSMGTEPVPVMDLGGFDRVDSSASPERFASWMDHQRAQMRDVLFAPLDIGADDVVLDIGCGTGVDLEAVSHLSRRAVGIDLSETMAGTARRRGSTDRFDVAVADGQRLPFTSASFDAVSCRAVLVHTPRPERTVAEMRRVLKPGGRVVLSEPDQGSHIVATPELEVFDRLRRHRQTKFRNPLIGRSLAELASGAGLTVTKCRAFPIVHRSLKTAQDAGGPFGAAVEGAVADGAISADEARRYIESLEALDERNGFFFAAMAVAVVATAPLSAR